jgi:hypothetical protein
MDGTPVGPSALAGLLELIVQEIRTANEVSFPSMHRFVILNGFLIPLAEQMAKDAEEKMPRLQDWDGDLESKNPTFEVLQEFDSKASHIKHKNLVSEGRGLLESKVERAWEEVRRANNVFGDQVKGDVQTETREVQVESKLGPIGGRGLLRKVAVTMQTMRIESRAVIHRKRGGDPELGPWMDTGSVTTRILEDAFEVYAMLPVLKGKLKKNSPNVLRQVMALAGMNVQVRACILKDGHFLWWEPDKLNSKDGSQASGCINLLINRAAVSLEKNGVFVIKPDGGWRDCSAFSGGEQRAFYFDASDCEVSAEKWVKAIDQHVQFANKAKEQLGEQKMFEQVGNFKPTLAQIDG